MVHKKFAVALLAAAVGACAQLPDKDAGPGEQLSTLDTPSSTASSADSRRRLADKSAPPPVDVWDRMRRGFTLERETDRAKVRDYITYFSNNQGYMARVTERSRRYIFHITEQLEQAGMPLELALLPIVESAYDPFAYSRARASGMWQFVPATGRSFGLHQNWWYDGRRDVEESTRAAIEYFAYLSERFDGDWQLVLAAYNAGEGRVRRAMEANRSKGLGTSYWDLKLPRETQNYVPQLLALAEVVARADYYRVPLHDIGNTPYYAAVNVGSQIDLAQAANLAGVEIDELYLLNPGHNRSATDPNGHHRLLLPLERKDVFLKALSQLPEDQRVSWQRYSIRRGDTLSTIARRYETSVAAIRETNKLSSNTIREGQTLVIPSAAAPGSQYAHAIDQRMKRQQASAQGQRTNYTVRPGDSLWSISRSLNVGVSQLASWNNMATSDTLRPGRKLVAYSGGASAADSSNNSRTTRKISYQVRSGDSLYRIARRYSLQVNDILHWNNIGKNNLLQPGQRLTLYVDSAANG